MVRCSFQHRPAPKKCRWVVQQQQLVVGQREHSRDRGHCVVEVVGVIRGALAEERVENAIAGELLKPVRCCQAGLGGCPLHATKQRATAFHTQGGVRSPRPSPALGCLLGRAVYAPHDGGSCGLVVPAAVVFALGHGDDDRDYRDQ